jgi:hypothetical protein
VLCEKGCAITDHNKSGCDADRLFCLLGNMLGGVMNVGQVRARNHVPAREVAHLVNEGVGRQQVLQTHCARETLRSCIVDTMLNGQAPDPLLFDGCVSVLTSHARTHRSSYMP